MGATSLITGDDQSDGSDRRPRLVIVCGLPGAGKTTHARRLEATLPIVRFCPDEWMVALGISVHDEALRTRLEGLQWAFAKRLLVLKQSVIIEWGTWARSERETLRQEARTAGAAVELHYLTAPIETLFDRIQRRGMEDPPIPLSDLRHWADLFQAPSFDEMALFDQAVTLET